MSTKISIIYGNPTDPAAFEALYPEHLALTRTLMGLRRVEAAKVWPKEDGGPTPAYRTVDLYFVDYDAASTALTTPEGGSFLPTIFDLGTGGVRILFSDIEED